MPYRQAVRKLSPVVLIGIFMSLGSEAWTQETPDQILHDVVSLQVAAREFEAQGAYRLAADHFREAAFVAQQLERPTLVAALLRRAGMALMRGNDPQLAVGAFERGLESLQEGGHFSLNDTLAELRNMEKSFVAPRLSVPDDVYTPETAATLEEEAADHRLPARLFLGAGNAYLAQPQNEPARRNYLSALEVAGVDESPDLKAQILTNLGIAERRLGKLAEAETRLAEALRLFDEGEDPTEARRAIYALGTVQLDRGEREAAESSFRKALRLHRIEGDGLGEARALAGLGKIQMLGDRLEEAEESFREAWERADAADDWDAKLHARFGLGVVLYETDRLDEAADNLQAALTLVDAHQWELRTDEGKVAYLETVRDLFDILLEIEIQRAQANPSSEDAWLAALNISEDVRGRATRDLMGARRRAARSSRHPPPPVPPGDDISQADQSPQATTYGDPNPWREIVYDEPTGPSSEDASPPGTSAPTDPPRPDIAGPRGEGEPPNPAQYAAGTELPGAGLLREPPPIPGLDSEGKPTDDVGGLDVVTESSRRRVWDDSFGQQDQDAAFTPSDMTWESPRRMVAPLARLSFHVLEERTVVFAVRSDRRVVGHVAPFGRDEIAARISGLRVALGVEEWLRGLRRGMQLASREPASATEEKPKKDPERARHLLRGFYRDLIAPIVENLPPGPEPVAVLPHGPLWLLPFAALENEEGGWLVDRWPMVFTSSPGVLNEVRSEGGAIGLEERHLLVVGDPLIPSDQRDLGFRQLNGARAEARAIYAMVPEQKRKTLLVGWSAKASRVAEIIREYDIVHFATHGLSFDEKPLDSYLVLAKSDTSDGRLTARQVIRDLEVPADLVALSACQTGLGRISGDGMLGLGRSFVVAGARSVLVSLWSVNDKATASLMTAFYKGYFDGESKATALQRAMQSVRSRREFGGPVFWAPFLLLGSEN